MGRAFLILGTLLGCVAVRMGLYAAKRGSGL